MYLSPHLRRAMPLAALLTASLAAWAGGPKYVAGVSYFNSGVIGQPVHWANGKLNYYVDQGPLNSSINNQQATAMVDAAAALWSAIPTAGVTLIDKGQLNENVSGANIVLGGTGFTVTGEQTTQIGVITQPSDITPTASSFSLAVIFDADGSVIDDLYGTGTSTPDTCQNNGVFTWLDNINPDATIAHGVILLNGLCATNANLVAMMNFELERAFGRILGLDYAQVDSDTLASANFEEKMGWPVMQPSSGACSATGGTCIPSPNQLRYDDMAALNRIYPITAGNLANFPGKQVTSANTVSIQGTVTFSSGMGMQGVNVVARPLDANGNPLDQYAVSFVSGSSFSGNHGNPISGWTDAKGNRLDMWGSNDATLQGFFDLSDMPLPPGVTTANYQVSFESVSPMDIYSSSVGPYLDGSPTPSGTLAPISVPSLSAGSLKTLTVNVSDSVAGVSQSAIGTQAAPRDLPLSGMWNGRLSQVGQSDWFLFSVRGEHSFSVVTLAEDETSAPTKFKAMPVLGVWNADAPVGSTPSVSGPGLNGWGTGESWLRVTPAGNETVRLGIADQRGDGRPDYAYAGWVLYADTISPQLLPATGGSFVIHGMGFRMADTVLVGGQPAIVTSISANEITAIAPAAATGITGSVNVEVDDLPIYYASTVVTGGLSYGAGTGDALNLIHAPMGTVPMGVPQAFSVTALNANMTPASGVSVVYTLVSGTAKLGCGASSCTVTASGSGLASMNVTAIDATWSIVTASLTNGSNLKAEFMGGTAPVLVALTPSLSVAAGATVSWPAQALVLTNGVPTSSQSVVWQTGMSGISVSGTGAAISNSSGIATQTLTVGPLAEAQQVVSNACLNGTSPCVAYTVFGARPEYATLKAVSGTVQSLSDSATPSPIILRVYDMDGNSMAGATVTLAQALYAWTPPCARHTSCVSGALLSTQTSSAASALDGTVTFTPASLPGVATQLVGLAATGNTATVAITIEQHP